MGSDLPRLSIMNMSNNNSAELALVRDDLAALRVDVGALIAHLQKGARELSRGVTGGGLQSAWAMSAWIE